MKTNSFYLFWPLQFLMVVVAIALSGVPDVRPAAPPDTRRATPTTPKTPSATPIYGVTIADPWNTAATSTALRTLSRRPTARIVFDENIGAKQYYPLVVELKKSAYLMGGILDSAYIKEYSVAAYERRTDSYLNTLGGLIKIWEVCNECNGEWTGEISEGVAKMVYAYNAVKKRRLSTALTLYYNDSCRAWFSREIFAWADENVPREMKFGLDYVFLSYYEDDCRGPQPNWSEAFNRLGTIFPNSKLGFGEIGTKKPGEKVEYLRRYYGLRINHPRYVGGYFWYYFSEDMVPDKPLLAVLNSAIQ